MIKRNEMRKTKFDVIIAQKLFLCKIKTNVLREIIVEGNFGKYFFSNEARREVCEQNIKL